jgi:hypothetical protein
VRGAPSAARRPPPPRFSPLLTIPTRAAGLPGFAGQVAVRHGPEPEERALAALAAAALGAAAAALAPRWAADAPALAAAEGALRAAAAAATPGAADRDERLAVVARLRGIARSGIRFCTGLDLEPFGSFVSGLYSPSGDMDLSIEGVAKWCAQRSRRIFSRTIDP